MGKYNRPTKTSKKVDSHENDATAYQQVGTFDKLPKPHLAKIKKPKTMTAKKSEKPRVDPALLGAEKSITTITIGEVTQEISTMNVYRKMQTVRSVIAKMELKQSGKNEEKGFSYFQLGDYLPQINILGEQIGLMTKFDMLNEKGILKIINIDKPEEVVDFELPTADLKMESEDGSPAEGIQIMKGKSTYMRRALFENAFEISVKDTVDSQGKKTTPEVKPEDDLDPRDIKAIEETTELEQLNTVCQSIRQRKGFNKNQALLKHYTTQKEKLSKEDTQ